MARKNSWANSQTDRDALVQLFKSPKTGRVFAKKFNNLGTMVKGRTGLSSIGCKTVGSARIAKGFDYGESVISLNQRSGKGLKKTVYKGKLKKGSY